MVIFYNTNKKDDDIQIEKCSLLLKLYFIFFFRWFFLVEGQKYPQDS